MLEKNKVELTANSLITKISIFLTKDIKIRLIYHRVQAYIISNTPDQISLNMTQGNSVVFSNKTN